MIEPDIQYHLVRAHDPEDILDVIRFDAMDIFTETNEVEYSLTNSILARKDVPDNSPDVPQARDIFSWRISQKYYFDPTFGGALVPGPNQRLCLNHRPHGICLRARAAVFTGRFRVQVRPLLQLRYGNPHRHESQRRRAAFWMPASLPT